MYKYENGMIVRQVDGVIIPNDEYNRDYVEYSNWLKDGNTLDVAPLTEASTVVVDARLWRNAQLAYADVMLNRVQDGETGLGTQKAWRAYRVELRNWPETEAFPTEKPVAPDAK